jgi:hypothetical protein
LLSGSSARLATIAQMHPATPSQSTTPRSLAMAHSVWPISSCSHSPRNNQPPPIGRLSTNDATLPSDPKASPGGGVRGPDEALDALHEPPQRRLVELIAPSEVVEDLRLGLP